MMMMMIIIIIRHCNQMLFILPIPFCGFSCTNVDCSVLAETILQVARIVAVYEHFAILTFSYHRSVGITVY
jgi:hypothetical protein